MTAPAPRDVNETTTSRDLLADLTEWLDRHQRGHENSNSPYGHICAPQCVAAALLASPALDAIVAERVAALADDWRRRIERETEWRDVREYGEEGTPFSNGARRMACKVRALAATLTDPRADA